MINETKSLFFEKYKQDGQDPGKSDWNEEGKDPNYFFFLP
jgi:hypothetical protein